MDSTQQLIYNKAIELLARRDHSIFELKQKLKQRFTQDEIIETVLALLQDERYLDEHRFAESYIRARSNKGYGPIRIRQELKEKRVETEHLEAALSESTCDWFDLAERVLQKKARPGQTRDFTELAKLKNYLAYRGFDSEQISHALEVLERGHEEL